MLTIAEAMSPALGDIRSAGPETWIYFDPSARKRPDFPKLWEALGIAVSRGAHLSVLREEAR